jgi:hypothetical protein
MASYVMVSPEEAKMLGLSGTMVDEAELAEAKHAFLLLSPEDQQLAGSRSGLTEVQLAAATAAVTDAVLLENQVALTDAELAAAIAAAPGGHREAQEAAAADAALFEDGPQDAQEGASEPPDVEVEAGVARKPRRARRPAGGGDGGQFTPDDPATPNNEAYE